MPRPDDTAVLITGPAAPGAPARTRRASRPVRVSELGAAEQMIRVLRGVGYRDLTLAVLGPGRFAVSWR